MSDAVSGKASIVIPAEARTRFNGYTFRIVVERFSLLPDGADIMDSCRQNRSEPVFLKFSPEEFIFYETY